MMHIKYTEKPICGTCGKPMREWNPFANKHEHEECTVNRIVDGLMSIVKQQLDSA